MQPYTGHEQWRRNLEAVNEASRLVDAAKKRLDEILDRQSRGSPVGLGELSMAEEAMLAADRVLQKAQSEYERGPKWKATARRTTSV